MKDKETKTQVTNTVNDYLTEVLSSARTRAELIESKWDRQNFAWSQCNATYYMVNQANKKLADDRAMQLSMIEEQEKDNEDGITVDSIVIDKQGQKVDYAINTVHEMNYQHNANLAIYREIAGSDWIPPSKLKARSEAKLKHIASKSDSGKLADQILKNVIQLH